MGFIGVNCQMDRRLWQRQNFPMWNQDWTITAVKESGSLTPSRPTQHNKLGDGHGPGASSISGNSAEQALMSCDGMSTHNVLAVQRDTFANMFHDSEDFVNSFLAMAIFDWRLQDTVKPNFSLSLSSLSLSLK
jgi:hypothetical protein